MQSAVILKISLQHKPFNATDSLLEDGLFLRALEQNEMFKENIYFEENPCNIGNVRVW